MNAYSVILIVAAILASTSAQGVLAPPVAFTPPVGRNSPGPTGVSDVEPDANSTISITPTGTSTATETETTATKPTSTRDPKDYDSAASPVQHYAYMSLFGATLGALFV